MPPTRVLHLVGSPTDAFHDDLSVLYARDALQALTVPGLQHVVAHVAADGRWRFPADLGTEALAAAEPVTVGPALERIAGLGADVALPQLFCRVGMTAYRGLLDVLGLPFVGNAPDVMALTADKARARAVVAAAGVDVPRGEVLRAGERPTLPTPAVVKPVDADNSFGVVFVDDPADYAGAVDAALRYADRALVEAYVPLGREVRCGVVGRGGRLVGLPLEEYRVDGVRSADDKLARDDDGELRLVAKGAERAWIVPEDDPVTGPVHDLARAAYRALGCRHYGLFDVRVDPDGRPWFLEASLYCSFAHGSVLCAMAAATGRSPADLFHETLEDLHDRR